LKKNREFKDSRNFKTHAKFNALITNLRRQLSQSMFLTSWYQPTNLPTIVCGKKKLPKEDPFEDLDDV